MFCAKFIIRLLKGWQPIQFLQFKCDAVYIAKAGKTYQLIIIFCDDKLLTIVYLLQ